MRGDAIHGPGLRASVCGEPREHGAVGSSPANWEQVVVPTRLKEMHNPMTFATTIRLMHVNTKTVAAVHLITKKLKDLLFNVRPLRRVCPSYLRKPSLNQF